MVTPFFDDAGLPSWYRHAACLDHPDPDIFFSAASQAALSVCARCPVRTPCGDYAIEQAFSDGVWGGLTEQARAQARQDDRAA